MPNRRSVLLGMGGAAIAAIVGVAGVRGPQTVADAATPDTPITFAYRGHTVALTISKGMAMVNIDGRKQVHIDRSGLQRFHSHLLPFQDYTDVRHMVRDIIDLEASRLVVL